MANANDLFDLTSFESNHDDILNTNINESSENTTDNENIDKILEATRYDLEFEKELNNYKNLWNTYDKYKYKMEKLKGDKKSNEYNQKVDKILKSKEDELEKGYNKLIKDYGHTVVHKDDKVTELTYFLSSIRSNPNGIFTKKDVGDVNSQSSPSIGGSIKNTEKAYGLHGADEDDGSVEPGRYNMKESTDEFGDKNPDTNHPEVDFDTNATAAKDTSIPVPGGDKETPSAKPEGGEKEIPVPGGDKEAPSAHPVDGASIPTPAKVVLSQDTYNDALSSLKKSFKEGYEIMELLEHATVQNKTTEDLQREFTENAIAEAKYESMINGPIFEAVERSDKKTIKNLIKTLRDKVSNFTEKDKVIFYKPAVFLRTFFNHSDDDISFKTIFLWQVLGGIILEEGNIQDYVKRLTEEFAEDLGDYKILAVRVHPTLTDNNRIRKSGKSLKKVFFLLIDKKLNSELKDAIKKLESGNDTSDKDKKNEVVTESVYDYDYEDDEV